MSRLFIVITMGALALAGCSPRVGVPKEPLTILRDRYDEASLKFDGLELGDKIRVKAKSVLAVTGQITRLAEQTYQRATDGVSFQFRCDNSSVTRSLDHDWQLIRYVSDPTGHTDFVVETKGVISFVGSLRTPKRVGDYELYLSVVEIVKNDSGTEVKAVRLPVKRLIVTVE